MIRLEHVTKEYDGFKACDDVSFTVEKGEILVILGPSGCGKSTTLRLINRMVERTSGTIEVKGRNVDDIKGEELRRGIGYVIQNTGLFPHMRVDRNIATVPAILGWDQKRTDDRVREMLDLVGLDHERYLKKYPRELSGGEAQRVGVARALASDPDIVLMDEPFGAVDPINRLRLQKEFSQIQRKLHKTVVFVTHDVEEAMLLGDRICIMRQGKVVQIGTPEEIVLKPGDSFVESFFGAEGALKLLSRYRAADYAEAVTAEGVALDADSSLKEALASMILEGRERVPVGTGSVALSSILDALKGRE